MALPKRCKPGDWVEIRRVILRPEERAPGVPADTAAVPLEMWVKGFALNEAALGERCRIETATGRVVEGELTDLRPGYTHTFGPAVPELQCVGRELRERLKEAASRG